MAGYIEKKLSPKIIFPCSGMAEDTMQNENLASTIGEYAFCQQQKVAAMRKRMCWKRRARQNSELTDYYREY